MELQYCGVTSPYLEEIKSEVISKASKKAKEFLSPLLYRGPSILADANEFQDDSDSTAEEKWLTLRRQYIGGSDAPPIFGVSPYRTNLDVYYDKIGRGGEQKANSDKELRFLYGHLAEDYLAAWCQKRWTHNQIIQDKRMFLMGGYPFIGADVDRIMKMVDGRYVILEFKTTTRAKMAQWENNQIPKDYEIQVRHYMAVLGLWEAIIVCMIDPETIFIRKVIRDLDLEYEILTKEISFWKDHVLQHAVPPPNGGNPKRYLQEYQRQEVGAVDFSAPNCNISSVYSSVLKLFLAKKKCKELRAELKKWDDTAREASIPIIEMLGNKARGKAEGPQGTFYVNQTTRSNSDFATLSVKKKGDRD